MNVGLNNFHHHLALFAEGGWKAIWGVVNSDLRNLGKLGHKVVETHRCCSLTEQFERMWPIKSHLNSRSRDADSIYYALTPAFRQNARVSLFCSFVQGQSGHQSPFNVCFPKQQK